MKYTQLIILSKPPPADTDFARFYGVGGFVGIRIEFSADGRLGSLTPVEKLPFGLTEKALEAARLIKFTPPPADGQPYSQTGVERYEFQPD